MSKPRCVVDRVRLAGSDLEKDVFDQYPELQKYKPLLEERKRREELVRGGMGCTNVMAATAFEYPIIPPGHKPTPLESAIANECSKTLTSTSCGNTYATFVYKETPSVVKAPVAIFMPSASKMCATRSRTTDAAALSAYMMMEARNVAMENQVGNAIRRDAADKLVKHITVKRLFRNQVVDETHTVRLPMCRPTGPMEPYNISGMVDLGYPISPENIDIMKRIIKSANGTSVPTKRRKNRNAKHMADLGRVAQNNCTHVTLQLPGSLSTNVNLVPTGKITFLAAKTQEAASRAIIILFVMSICLSDFPSTS